MESHFIYNPHGVGSNSHSASACLHNNELFSSWYAYEEKETDKGQICIAKYNYEKNVWEKSKAVFNNLKEKSCGNPVLFSDPTTNTLHLYFVILKYHYWDSSVLYHSFSEDGGETWSDYVKVNLPEGYMIRHRPFKLDNSSILIPAYDEKKFKSIFYKASFPYSIWQEVSDIDGEYIQSDLISLGFNQLQAYMRPAGDTDKNVFRIASSDNGSSWGMPINTKLNCPLSGVAAIALKDSLVAVCHNDNEQLRRTPLTVSFSFNNGVTFEKKFVIDSGDIELSYPTMILDAEDKINLLYTFNRRMIKHVRFTKEELINNG